MCFRASSQRTCQPYFAIRRMNSSRLPAFLMHRSTADASLSLMLFPFTAERYSRADIPLDSFLDSTGRTERPWALHSVSDRLRSVFKVFGPCRSIFPVLRQTAFTMKWVWMWGASLWVAMSTSLSGHARAENSFARRCASSGVTGSSGWKDWT